MSRLYLDRLDKERQEIFYKLRSFSRDFVLAGGTAIMLQIGHRQSFDFDCFSLKELSVDLTKIARRVFGSTTVPIVNNKQLCLLKTSNNIEIHFVYHPFTFLNKAIKTESIPIAHLDDLAGNKVYTIGRRGVWRDYVDLFFLLKWNIYSMKKLISLAEKKFSNEFNPKLFLQQLVYFKDLEIGNTIFIKEKYTNDQIKAFLSKKVDHYIKKTIHNRQ